MSKKECLAKDKKIIFYRTIGDTKNNILSAMVNKSDKRYSIGDILSINECKYHVLFRDKSKSDILVLIKRR